jgi:hypothetical protein
LRHEGYVMEMPQSGERIRGPENMRAFQRTFGDHSNLPSIRLRPVLVRDGLWVKEEVNDYGGQAFHGHRRAAGREDLAGHTLLWRAVRGSGLAGAAGRTDGNRGAC